MEHKKLFDEYKYCEICNVPMPVAYENSVCPGCVEEKLFRDVKEYIRANDVTEYDVAYEFHIPVRKVKKWIQEGRIEYKEDITQKNIMHVHCKICGKQISFGTVCSNCLKQSTSLAHASSAAKQETENADRIGHISFLTNAHD